MGALARFFFSFFAGTYLVVNLPCMVLPSRFEWVNGRIGESVRLRDLVFSLSISTYLVVFCISVSACRDTISLVSTWCGRAELNLGSGRRLIGPTA